MTRFLTLALLAAALPLRAGCLNLTATPPASANGGSYKLTWDNVIGAVGYEVAESYDGRATWKRYAVQAQSLTLQHHTSLTRTFSYVVTPVLNPDILAVTPSVSEGPGGAGGTTLSVPPLRPGPSLTLGVTTIPCTDRIEVQVGADPAFRALTRRAIIPIVGSTPGANGARFRTALRLTATAGNQHGRIVFHPAAKAAADDDPSLPYAFGGIGFSISWDDVIEAMGQSGVGSIDLIPDDDGTSLIPRVEVRLYAEAPNGGSFGAFEPAVAAHDFLAPAPMNVEIPDARFRVNLGLRALTDVTLDVFLFDTQHRIKDLKSLHFAAGAFTLTGASSFVGTTLVTGESIQINFHGSAVPFYTLTDNVTNDPAAMVPPSAASGVSVGDYVD